jgi:hypothetical protein
MSRLCLGYVSAVSRLLSAVSRLYPAAASRLCLAGSASMKEPSASVKGRFEFMVICCGIFFACAYARIFWSICPGGWPFLYAPRKARVQTPPSEVS